MTDDAIERMREGWTPQQVHALIDEHLALRKRIDELVRAWNVEADESDAAGDRQFAYLKRALLDELLAAVKGTS